MIGGTMKVTDMEIYDFIARYREEHGWSPTVREIGRGVGLSSTSTVHGRIEKMKYKGMLKDGGPNAARTLTTVPIEEWGNTSA